MDIPEWLDLELWTEFRNMRKKIRAPLTEYGEKLILRKLESFRDWGYDANLSLAESIERSWRGVFPQGTPELRDQHGMKYRITAEGTRQYIQ